MKTRFDARGGRPRAPMLAACLMAAAMTCAAVVTAPEQAGAQAPTDGFAETGGVGEGARAGQPVTAARLAGTATRHVRFGARVRVRGTLRPGYRGRPVRLQLRRGDRWLTVDRARTRRGGRFRAAWRPPEPGRYRVRVRFAGDRRNSGARRIVRGIVHVYRPSEASWYGPGFYGNHTACGQVLGYATLGVAHKYLPCGTRVTLRYGGRSVTVRVIDRGPFAGAREWDLTEATKRRLRFPDVGTVWSAHR